ncbi:MAG: AI-2E family transporter, partial [Candidatus Dormibacteraeota bacterium]|nr:AI-2E family transporter [Candidatus Dormibacteraeota bacterium]
MSEAQGARQQAPARTVRWDSVPQPVRILVYLLIALVALQVYHQENFIFAHIFSVLLLFVFAAIIALLLTPAIDRLEHTGLLHGRRGLAVLVVNLGLLLVLGGGIALLVPLIGHQANDFKDEVPRLYARGTAFLNGFQTDFARFGISMNLPGGGTSGIGSQLFNNAFKALQSFISALINILLIAVISIYLESQGRELVAAVRRLFHDHQEQVDFFLVATGSTVLAYVRGQLIMALLMGVYTGLALTLIGVKFAFVIGIAVFFLEFIPLVGAPVGMALGVVFALLQSPFLGVLAAIIGVGGHAIEAYIIGPRITGNATRLHPLAAMAALLIGADVGGVLGALFAVPIAGVINVYLGALYKSSRGHEDAFALPEHRDATIEDLPRLGEEISEVKEEGMEGEPVPRALSDRPPRRRTAPRTTGKST